ncbi:MAG: N-acetyl sugar amidotransferase [Rubrivivax sp.]|nr:MAG: N-acetyl sugar amidotransferase [Rubrivivax sp.]
MTIYQCCTRCVMDTSAPGIHFDAQGHCNFCSEFLTRMSSGEGYFKTKQGERQALLDRVRKGGQGRDYDCIVGVSGGVDSAYALYLAKQAGLRPLAVHLDNGWNSELAVKNIENLVRKLDVDLYTHVIEWRENRDMQGAFFKANVIDIELLMDNAMLALNYQQAKKRGVRFILAGTNQATEGMKMPSGWNHFKMDARNIRAIHRQHGSLSVKTHPLIGTLDFLQYRYVQKIQWISFLDYFDYNKEQALTTLVREVDYKPYPYKHYESVFTRFYQGYILPTKFGVDKRRLHLSTLVCTGQMMREQALKTLETNPYPDGAQLEEDRAFVLKKLGFDKGWFKDYLGQPAVAHDHFPSEKERYLSLIKLKQRLMP